MLSCTQWDALKHARSWAPGTKMLHKGSSYWFLIFSSRCRLELRKKEKKYPVQWPFKTSDKSPYDPWAPITKSYCKCSLCIFVCLNAASTARKHSEGKENWRNVKIQRTIIITWRAEVLSKWSYSQTPSMLQTSDQNGTVDNDILIILYPYFISCNFKRLS